MIGEHHPEQKSQSCSLMMRRRSLLIHLVTLLPILPPKTGTTDCLRTAAFYDGLIPHRDLSQMKLFVCGLPTLHSNTLLVIPLSVRHNVNRLGFIEFAQRLSSIYAHIQQHKHAYFRMFVYILNQNIK